MDAENHQTPTKEQQEEPANGAAAEAATNGATNPTTEPPTDPAIDPASVTIALTFTDNNGNDISFKLKRTTRLKKAMDAYSAKSQKEVGTLRFLFEGERVAAEDTAETMGLEDDDKIEVHMEQIGGGDGPNKPLKNAATDSFWDTASDHIKLSVGDPALNNWFKLKRTTKLRKATKAYAVRVQKDIGALQFTFKGWEIKSEDTAETLSMENGDKIEVHSKLARAGPVIAAEGDEQWLLVNPDDDDLCEDSEDDMPVAKAAPAPEYKLKMSFDPTTPPNRALNSTSTAVTVFGIQHGANPRSVRWYKVDYNTRLTKTFQLHAKTIGIPFEELVFSLDGLPVHHNTVAPTFAMRDARAVFISSRR